MRMETNGVPAKVPKASEIRREHMDDSTDPTSTPTPFIALDDLPDADLPDTLALLWWLRLSRRPAWYVRAGSDQQRLAENLCRCGLVHLSFGDDDMDTVSVELAQPRRATR